MDALSPIINHSALSLRDLLSCADSYEKTRIQNMIAYRRSQEAMQSYLYFASRHSIAFVERACSYNKKISMQLEEVPLHRLKGNFLERTAAMFKPVALMYRFVNSAAGKARNVMHKEGTKGVLSGYLTDEFYQSPKLFQGFEAFESGISYFEQLKRNSAGTIEMRNRLRRVLRLSLSEERLSYFKELKHSGIGNPQNPLIIASIGGGTGSVEMDIQQDLRDRHNIYSRIIIFDVVDYNRIIGSFFAKMRGADICWIIHKPDIDDLLTLRKKQLLERFLPRPLIGLDPYNNPLLVAENSYGLCHHIIMSGLWAKFDDENVSHLLHICKQIMHPFAEAVVTLSQNKYTDKNSKTKTIPSMRIIDHLGHAHNGVWYRDTDYLRNHRLLEKNGFILKKNLNGAIFPTISIGPRVEHA